jgi:hypothetical protein
MYSSKQIIEAIKDVASSSDSTIYGRTGKVIKIPISTNPADGCEWVPEYDSQYLTLVYRNLYKDTGTSWTGKDVFVFRAEKAGTTEVVIRSGKISISYFIEIFDTQNTDQIQRLEKGLL